MGLEEEILQTDLGSVSKEAGVMEDRKTVAATGLGKRCGEVLRKQERWRKDETKGEVVKKARKWLLYPQHQFLRAGPWSCVSYMLSNEARSHTPCFTHKRKRFLAKLNDTTVSTDSKW